MYRVSQKSGQIKNSHIFSKKVFKTLFAIYIESIRRGIVFFAADSSFTRSISTCICIHVQCTCILHDVNLKMLTLIKNID